MYTDEGRIMVYKHASTLKGAPSYTLLKAMYHKNEADRKYHTGVSDGSKYEVNLRTDDFAKAMQMERIQKVADRNNQYSRISRSASATLVQESAKDSPSLKNGVLAGESLYKVADKHDVVTFIEDAGGGLTLQDVTNVYNRVDSFGWSVPDRMGLKYGRGMGVQQPTSIGDFQRKEAKDYLAVFVEDVGEAVNKYRNLLDVPVNYHLSEEGKSLTHDIRDYVRTVAGRTELLNLIKGNMVQAGDTNLTSDILISLNDVNPEHVRSAMHQLIFNKVSGRNELMERKPIQADESRMNTMLADHHHAMLQNNELKNQQYVLDRHSNGVGQLYPPIASAFDQKGRPLKSARLLQVNYSDNPVINENINAMVPYFNTNGMAYGVEPKRLKNVWATATNGGTFEDSEGVVNKVLEENNVLFKLIADPYWKGDTITDPKTGITYRSYPTVEEAVEDFAQVASTQGIPKVYMGETEGGELPATESTRLAGADQGEQFTKFKKVPEMKDLDDYYEVKREHTPYDMMARYGEAYRGETYGEEFEGMNQNFVYDPTGVKTKDATINILNKHSDKPFVKAILDDIRHNPAIQDEGEVQKLVEAKKTKAGTIVMPTHYRDAYGRRVKDERAMGERATNGNFILFKSDEDAWTFIESIRKITPEDVNPTQGEQFELNSNIEYLAGRIGATPETVDRLFARQHHSSVGEAGLIAGTMDVPFRNLAPLTETDRAMIQKVKDYMNRGLQYLPQQTPVQFPDIQERINEHIKAPKPIQLPSKYVFEKDNGRHARVDFAKDSYYENYELKKVMDRNFETTGKTLKWSVSRSTARRTNTLHKDLQALVTYALADAPIDVSIISGSRTAKEQHKLYQQGRTTPGSIVTNADGYEHPSSHQGGRAFDFIPAVRGRKATEEDYRILGEWFKAKAELMGIEVVWGGDWESFVDMPHIQLEEGY